MSSLPFLAAAGLLTLAVLTWLSYPLLKSGAARDRTSRRALNTAIYRDQLAELERDRAAGNLGEADYAQARDELQHRLLEDAGEAESATAVAMPAKSSALALALLLPVGAAGLYLWLGNPAALEIPGTRHEISADQINDMVAKLAARMAQNPDDLKGWSMLARSYKALRRFEEGEKAFEQVMRLGGGDDPNVLADFADLLAVRAGGNIEGKPLELVNRALQINPEHTMALALAGSAAYAREDFAATAGYWERLLKLLPPESEDARALTTALEEVRAKGGATKQAATAKPGPVAANKSVSGQVSLAPALAAKVQPGDTLFVFARAIDGSRMPLAVLRARVADLPLKFTLDDSLALNPELKISAATQLKVEARISKSGDATSRPGDLSGESGPLKPGAGNVKILIERATP